VFGACDPRASDSDGASDANFCVGVLLLGCFCVYFNSLLCSCFKPSHLFCQNGGPTPRSRI